MTAGGDTAQVARQAALAELGLLGLSAPPQQELVDGAVARIARGLQADVVAVCELAGDARVLHVRGAAGRVEAAFDDYVATGASAAAYVLAREGPVLDEELVATGRHEGSPQHALAMASGASLRIDGTSARPYGILHVHFAAPHPFAEDELAFLRTAAAILAAAIGVAQRAPMFELSADLLGVVAVDGGHLVRVNPAWQRLLGWTPDELYARPLLDFFSPEDHAVGEARFLALVAPGAELLEFEDSLRTRAGHDRHLLWSARTSDDGRWIYCTAKDITGRRERETALAQSAAEHALILQSAGDGILRMDTDGMIVYVNPAGAELLGWPARELLGRRAHETMHHSRADGSPYPWSDCPNRRTMVSDATAHVVDEVFWRSDGTSFPVEYTSAPVHARDTVTGAVIVFSDVTARRQLETEARLRQAAEHANRAKSEFLSRMSHELRTPLNAVLGFGQLLERAPLEQQHLRYVEHILKGGRHLLALVNEVLDIARIESGDLGLSVEPVALMVAVYEALDMIAPLAEQHGIAVDVDLGEHAGAYVLADLQRLKQIMLNLLSNAVKYNVEGGRVRIAARSDGEELVVVVADTGKGISAADLPKLFSPFERLGAEGSDVDGTGLGLALSRRLAEAMRGSLDVVSRPRQGSTFELRLASAERPQGAPHRAAAGAESPVVACTVLHVEDNIANVRLVEEVFAGDVVQVVAAGTGQLGIDIAATMQPDVVLLDLHLPDMPGWDVLRALRDRPQTAHTPVIVLTADASPAQERRMLALGVAHHLTKPLDIDELRSAVTTACGVAGSADGGR